MKLIYFGVYARGEAIRMLLNHGKIQYEEQTVTFPEWATLKHSGKFEFGQLPGFEWDDGTEMSQSSAILRALGMKYGYYPTGDSTAMWLCDSTIDAINDTLPKAADIFFKPTDGEKADALKSFCDSVLPAFLSIMNTRLNGRVYVTGKLSIADFNFGAFLSSTCYNTNSPHQKTFENVSKNYPNVVAFWQNFSKENADYLAKRPAAFF